MLVLAGVILYLIISLTLYFVITFFQGKYHCLSNTWDKKDTRILMGICIIFPVSFPALFIVFAIIQLSDMGLYMTNKEKNNESRQKN